MKLYITCLLALFATSHADSNLRGSRQEDEPTSNVYRITLLQHLTRSRDGQFGTSQQIVTNPIVDGVESHSTFDIDLPAHILDEYEDLLVSGELFIEATGTSIDQDNKVVFAEDSVVSVLEESRRPQRRNLALKKERTMAVVRVTMAASGETCDYTAQQLEYQLFHRDGFSLTDHMMDCSDGAVHITSAGVYEVTVPGRVDDYPHQAGIKDKALEAFAQLKGITNARSAADHVYVIIPKNNYWAKNGFVGTGETGGTIINVDNKYALDMTVYMHETGHNLGLGDSRVDVKNHMDQTGIMGMAPWYANSEGPLKCYNAAGNRELGFFSSRSKFINLNANPAQRITVAAFSEVSKSNKADPVILTFGAKHALQYNFASSFNEGTEYWQNTVLMSYTATNGNSYTMEPGLSPGGAINEVQNFDGTGKTLRVEACKQINGSSVTPNSMEIAMTLGMSGSPCAVAKPPPPTTTAPPPVTTVAPPVTTVAPPVTTVAPPVTTVPPPVTGVAPPKTAGTCSKNGNKRACRRSTEGCMWTDADGCMDITAQVCAKLSRRTCKRTRGCQLQGNFCTVEEPVDARSCEGMARRACRSTLGCAYRNKECIAVESNTEGFFI